MSPFLFSKAIEPLAIALRSSEVVEGAIRGGLEHKISLYADDILLFISDPMLSAPMVLNTLETFVKISGYKLNLHKCEMFCILPHDGSTSLSTFPFKRVTNKFTYLGVSVTPHFKDLL